MIRIDLKINGVILLKSFNLDFQIEFRILTYYKFKKTIYQYDLNKNLIKIWDCISDIKEELNIKGCVISACCLGRTKTSHGYIWKYTSF